MIKVGIVGCGLMGGIHAKLIRGRKDAKLVGVADQDLDRATVLASQGVAGHVAKDLEDLLAKAKPDVVHIVTPPGTHARLACMALGSGCHVYLEKPMSLNVEEARAMAAAAKENNRLLTVGYNHLFDPVIQKVHRRIDTGCFGNLVGINIFHNSVQPLAAWKRTLPSGPWFNDIDHLLYIAEHFLGDIQRVQAIGIPDHDGPEIMELHLAVQHAKGWGSLTYSATSAPYQVTFVLYGTKRTMEVDLISGLVIERRQCKLHRWLRKGIAQVDVASQLLMQTGFNSMRVLTGHEQGWTSVRRLFDRFYQAVRQGAASPVSIDNCIRIVEIKEEIRDHLMLQQRALFGGQYI